MENNTRTFVVAYSRVSTVTQNLGRQTEGFSSSEFDRVYSDKVSGMTPFAERPSGARLLADCESGSVKEVHFWDISRAGRDILDVTTTMQFFVKRGIQVVVHKESIRLLDDDGKMNPTASIVLSVMTALSAIERQNIRERTLEGIAIAKAQGKYVGRKHGTTESADRFLAKERSQKIRMMLEERYPIIHIAKLLQVSTTTCIKVKREMKKSGIAVPPSRRMARKRIVQRVSESLVGS